jgi:hypothetical protein
LKPIRESRWKLVLKHRTLFETMVNDAMALFMKQGIRPNKRQVCEEIGLDWHSAEDRSAVSLAIAANKKYVDMAYREAFIPLGLWDAAYQKAADDHDAYKEWKRKDAQFVEAWYANGWTEEDLREVWIYSRIWEEFLKVINRYNLYVFVAVTGTPFKKGSFKYEQPDFWDYLVNQIDVCRRLQKGAITTLERHRILGMILTSGEPVEKTIQVQQDGYHMVADGAPMRYRCELCEEDGILIAFSTQKELFEHFKKVHAATKSTS